MRLTILFALSVVCLFWSSSNGVAWAESPYRLNGIVTDVDTKEPVANAKVKVLIESESEPSKRLLTSSSGKDGRYSVELPAGHAWGWPIAPPDGYTVVESKPMFFATTDEHPVYTRNYEVRKGVPVQVLVRFPDALSSRPKTFVSLYKKVKDDYIQAVCEINPNDGGVLSLPRIVGSFQIHCGDEHDTLITPDAMTAEFDDGFDPLHVTPEIERDESGTVVVKDANGRVGRFTKCDAAINDHQLTVVINVSAIRSNDEPMKLKGRVVDDNAKSIEGAMVTAAFYSSGGSASSRLSTVTNDKGEFILNNPRILRDGDKIGLVVTCKGFGGFDTSPVDVNSIHDGVANFDSLTLKRACSIRVRAIGPDGAVLHGAVVEPIKDYASRTRVARTGSDGECLITDLAPGMVRFSASFGTMGAASSIPLDPGDNGLVTLRFVQTTAPSETNSQEVRTPLKAGTVAPDWKIAEWTDGTDRKLSDFRGKVVFLDFWGTWCGGCLVSIPAMKELHQRYKDQDVVFIGIHTAGTEMIHVKRLLKQRDWDLLVGLDADESTHLGETAERFMVHGYPTFVVIDRNGMVAYNTDEEASDPSEFEREMKEAAKVAGLPWPIDQDVSEEEESKRMVQLQIVMFSRQIEKALRIQMK